MSNHTCLVKHITDLLACKSCGNNQICCKQCFSSKHRSQKGPIHESTKLVDSDVYKNFLRLVHVEWLVGQKVLKSLGGFELANQATKQYLVNTAFYGSQFYKEFFPDELSAQQYLLLKCYYSGDPKQFMTLSSLQKLLNDAKSLDIISKYVSRLSQPTEEEKVMNSHIDFYTGADFYYLADFFAKEQEIFAEYLNNFEQKKEGFSIYGYIEWRQKLCPKPRNQTYYSKQYTAFLVEYYRKDAAQKSMFTLTDYTLSYWQFFHTIVQIHPTVKQFIQSEVNFYTQYEQLMQKNSLNITYLGFKIWKLSNGVSQELPYLKNHYFLFAFVEGYLQMRIERTYVFLTQEEKDAFAKESWMDFVKYIKDYSLLLQEKNRLLKEEEERHEFTFETYRVYFNYRKRMQPFHELLKAGKENIYDKNVAMRFFNHYFESPVTMKQKLYKEFFDKCQEEKRKEKEKLAKLIQQLKEQLQTEEKETFYGFIYVNFINYCEQKDVSINKENYQSFKSQVLQTMDLDFINLTQEKFQRGDYNEVFEEDTQEMEENEEEPQVSIGETGAKIVVGMDVYEKEILVTNQHEDQESDAEDNGVCPCCRDDIYNCENTECQLMGYCSACCE